MAEYEAGKRGEETPAAPIWLTPKEQLDRVLGLINKAETEPPPSPEELTADADEVTAAMRGVDWAGVRAATSARTGDATRAMRAMAQEVDWNKVQPVAAQVSSALIAAVASGKIGVGGPLGSSVARAIANQGGLAQRVGTNMLAGKEALPPDFRDTVEARPPRGPGRPGRHHGHRPAATRPDPPDGDAFAPPTRRDSGPCASCCSGHRVRGRAPRGRC